MILTNEQIVNLLKKPLNADSISKGVSLQKDHKVHVTGENFDSILKKLSGYESGNDFSIKKQISKPATIQITSIILDNLNRWTSAQGTVKRVDFRSDKKNKQFQEVLNQVWNNQSLNEFIKTFYKEAIYTEFNGFVIVTKPKKIEGGLIEKNGIVQHQTKDNLDPYLIFISASDVYDQLTTGDKTEYIIIKLADDKNGNQQFRVIDDAFDRVITWNKDKIVENIELKNEIGYVPARKIIGINKYLLNDQVKTSPIDHIIPALDRYLSSDIDTRMQFIRHNYPKLAIVMKDCVADGCVEGYTHDNDTKLKCTTCQGSGKVIPISRDGVIGLPEYLRDGDTAFPGAPASYITPDTDSLRLAIEDLVAQRKDIIYSGTGDKGLISESLNTATENMINSRSLEDRISEIATEVENFETFIIQTIKDMHSDFKNISEYVINIHYGRRISIKSENELSDEIKRAKDNALPNSFIQSLQRDLIYAKYKNNNEELNRQLLLSDAEPLAAYTIKELLDMREYISEIDLQLKANYDTIVDQWEENNNILTYAPNKTYNQRVIALRNEFYEILQGQIRERNAVFTGAMGASQET